MKLINSPFLVLVSSFVLMVLAAWIGDLMGLRLGAIDEAERDDFTLVLSATLTLLGLIIGFSFSMATTPLRLAQELRRGRS
jgi:hypothetical protein